MTCWGNTHSVQRLLFLSSIRQWRGFDFPIFFPSLGTWSKAMGIFAMVYLSPYSFQGLSDKSSGEIEFFTSLNTSGP